MSETLRTAEAFEQLKQHITNQEVTIGRLLWIKAENERLQQALDRGRELLDRAVSLLYSDGWTPEDRDALHDAVNTWVLGEVT